MYQPYESVCCLSCALRIPPESDTPACCALIDHSNLSGIALPALRLRQTPEHLPLRMFVAQTAVERLTLRGFPTAARLDEQRLRSNFHKVGPHRFRNEPVVRADEAQCPSAISSVCQHLHHIPRLHAPRDTFLGPLHLRNTPVLSAANVLCQF